MEDTCMGCQRVAAVKGGYCKQCVGKENVLAELADRLGCSGSCDLREEWMTLTIDWSDARRALKLLRERNIRVGDQCPECRHYPPGHKLDCSHHPGRGLRLTATKGDPE